MILCRLHSTAHNIINVIGTSLHNLEELFLDYIQAYYSEIKNKNPGAIECFVTGCPKLKILHVNWKSTLESVQYVLLGLPNLIEFKHPLMVFALEQIIQNGRADSVSAIRNLYIGEKVLCQNQFSATYVLKSVQRVMNHLHNITKLDITIPSGHSKMSLKTFSATVSNLTNLTELTLKDYRGNVLPIIEAIGHQLNLLDLSCHSYPRLDVIDQCRELRVLRITVLYLGSTSPYYLQSQSYGSDLQEEFIAFQHLQELYLNGLNAFHFEPTLIKSLIASPVLQELKLKSTHIITEDILKAVFNHINQDREQLAFTSLRKLEFERYDNIKKYMYFIDTVSHERVPLEILVFNKCSKNIEMTRRRFAVQTVYDDEYDFYFDSDSDYDNNSDYDYYNHDTNYDYDPY